MPEQSDRELWRLAADGESDAFGRLFERHAQAIYTFCFRRTADWNAAEDLTSVVFLEAWRRREVSLERDEVLPFLYGVAVNVLRNRGRSLRRHTAALARVPPPAPVADHADEVADRVDDERAMRRILGVVQQLHRRDLEVLELCVWAGMPYERAAQTLGIPIGTVRSRLSRARARLRELAASGGHESDEHAPARAALTGADIGWDEEEEER